MLIYANEGRRALFNLHFGAAEVRKEVELKVQEPGLTAPPDLKSQNQCALGLSKTASQISDAGPAAGWLRADFGQDFCWCRKALRHSGLPQAQMTAS